MSDFDPNKMNLPTGVFLVREGKGRGNALTVHALKPLSETARRETIRRLSRDGTRQVRFRLHATKTLKSARSLAAVEKAVDGGAIVYDPTAIFSRAEQLTRCAEMLRFELGAKAEKVLLDATRRTLFVTLAHGAFEGHNNSFREDVGRTMATVAKVMREWRKNPDANFEISVRVGFEAPQGSRLVAVDDRSRPNRARESYRRNLTRLRVMLRGAAIGAFAAAAPTAALADGDMTAAVANPNVTVLGAADYIHFDGKSFVEADGGASADLPLGHDFGFQADVGGGSMNYWGVGGHLFWRDPDWALLGAVLSHESFGGTVLNRYGGEAELYLNRFTLSGAFGYEDGGVPDGEYGRVDVSFYATPSFVLRAGYDSVAHLSLGTGQIEYQPAPQAWSGLSLFADSTFGEGVTVFSGLKFHFGMNGLSLMDIDRHEDPGDSIFNLNLLTQAHYLGHHHLKP